jgi:hypothetical protein
MHYGWLLAYFMEHGDICHDPAVIQLMNPRQFAAPSGRAPGVSGCINPCLLLFCLLQSNPGALQTQAMSMTSCTQSLSAAPSTATTKRVAELTHITATPAVLPGCSSTLVTNTGSKPQSNSNLRTQPEFANL